MIVDTSALVAILRGEPRAKELMTKLTDSATTKISAGTLLEVQVVVDRRGGSVLGRRLDDLVKAADVRVEPVTEAHAAIGRQAYRDFGKGSGHQAKLNLGDCFAYALARETGEPLLFVGGDFGHTDVQRA